MNFLDIFWNLFRKSLGNNLYRKLKKSPLGRPYDYYSLSTYKSIFDHYKSQGFDFKSKRILEVGCGEQFYTAFFFISNGAKSVTLVDPVLNEQSNAIKMSQFGEYKDSYTDTPVSVNAEIEHFNSLDSIPSQKNEKYDIICSHFVLEHFRDLDSFFSNTSRLLAHQGLSYNFVDLSNHAYHLFDSRNWTKWLYRSRMLSHLKYSEWFYDAITDKRIWVNRLLVPAYRSLAKKYCLRVLRLDSHLCKSPKIHNDVLYKSQIQSNSEELNVTHFSMLLEKA